MKFPEFFLAILREKHRIFTANPYAIVKKVAACFCVLYNHGRNCEGGVFMLVHNMRENAGKDPAK